MNKELMISMKPEHAVNILNGKKTLELRTWISKDYVGWVYGYISKNKPYISHICEVRVGVDEVCYYETFDIPHFGDVDLNGKVAFRFWFDEYDTLTYEDFWDRHDYIANDGEVGWEVDSDYIKLFCLDYQDILDYGFREKPHRHQVDLYAWHIKDLEIFDKPKKLSEFYKALRYDNGETVTPNICNAFSGSYESKRCLNLFRVKRAPQKCLWVYVKELENER
jgi:hypothetical protein